MPPCHTRPGLRRKPGATPTLLARLTLALAAACPAAMHAAPAGSDAASLALAPLALPFAAEAAQWLSDDRFLSGADKLVSGERDGLFVLDARGAVLARAPGAYGAFDHRAGPGGLLVAALDEDRQQAALLHWPAGGAGPRDRQAWQPAAWLLRTAFRIEGLCLYRDEAGNDFAFLVGEEGLGEQWLVGVREAPLARPLRVRGLSLPPASEHCHADDAAGLVYVNEENVGLWAYPAAAEAPLERRPVDLVRPFGKLAAAAAGMAAVPGGLLALDPEAAALHRYAGPETGAGAGMGAEADAEADANTDTDKDADAHTDPGPPWRPLPALALAGADEPERIHARVRAGGLDLLVRDDSGVLQGRLAWLPSARATDPATSPTAGPTSAPALPVLPVLPAQGQTELMPSLGDAADDPAIWVHPTDPRASRVLGTDKQGGLLVYDLQGKQLQDLRVGRINNVDVRPGFDLGGRAVDLAVGSNRDRNSLHAFAIDRASGQVSELGQVDTPLSDIYGLCMYKDPAGAIYAIANDKDGTFLQYRLEAPDGRIAGHLTRRFRVDSQPEGCTADDRSGRLYVGEEDVAVWALDAAADAPAVLAQVMPVGPMLHADIEGMAIYQGKRASYLVVSSQGNDSYVVLDAAPPYALRGAFRIGLNAELGIDGASETDGLEVTSADLGGIWSRGMLVVQDGRKRMPEGTQNYKYLPWSAVAEALGLE